MPKLPFTVSARTAKLIGQENFANAEGAIIELVKNAYDADAKNCIIIFDIIKNNIYIIDNGTGMTQNVIENEWMTIGTNNKKKNHTSKTGRVKSGAKGIGRFALDRLGSKSTMYTFPEKIHEKIIWKVDWNKFNNENLKIHDVKANIRNFCNLNIKEFILNKFGKYKNIQRYIQEYNNNLWSQGTILKIENIKDTWDEDVLNVLFKNLEVLRPPVEQKNDFNIHLYSTDSEEYGEIKSIPYDDYDYKLNLHYLGNNKREVEIVLRRNELEINKLQKEFKEIFDSDDMKHENFTLESFNKDELKYKTSLLDFKGYSNIDEKLLESIGAFEFTFYYIKNTEPNKKEIYPYKSINTSVRRAWLKKYSGIKIFRDGFRVRPYGENGNDWLSLGERQGLSPAGAGQNKTGFRVRPNQISGTINISRLTNLSFNDKSGREGFQENETFELFKNILLDFINIFEKDRNIIMHSLYRLNKEKQDIKEKARIEAERIRREQETERIKKEAEEKAKNNIQVKDDISNEEKKQKEKDELFATATETYEQELKDKNEEIRLLRSLASVGLTISSFAHEVKSLRSRLIPRNEHLINELRKYIDEDNLNNIQEEENPFYMLKLNLKEDIKLKHWLDYSLNSLKRDKRERKNINIFDYFKSFEDTWEKALERRKIKLNINTKRDSTHMIRAFEVDLDIIFNNFLSNSISAYKGIPRRVQKRVSIDWNQNKDFIEITFSDNGIGLPVEYKKNPNEIFEFNETSKRDQKGNIIGTGLGLYLVKTIIEEYKSASVKLLNIDNGFSVKIILPLVRKNQNEL